MNQFKGIPLLIIEDKYTVLGSAVIPVGAGLLLLLLLTNYY